MNRRDVLWASTLPRRPRADEEIVVTTTAQGSRRIDIRPRADAQPPAASLPVGTPLLGQLGARPYGVEERATAVAVGTSLVVTCREGLQPAGIVLAAPFTRHPRAASVELVVAHQGDRFALAPSPSGADAPSGTAMPAARSARVTRVPLSHDLTQAPAVQFVVQCPTAASQFRLDDVRLVATRPAATAAPSAWAWKPSQWRTAADKTLDSATYAGVRRLHVSVEIDSAGIRHAPALARFVRLATMRGIAVDVVEGDPRMTRVAGRRLAVARARAIAEYQRHAAPGERLDAVQYDVEPYLLPEFGADPVATLQAWSRLHCDVAGVLGVPVDAVVPFWLTSQPGGEAALDGMAACLRQLTVMSYRTDPALVTVISEPLLAWGQDRGLPVRIALEAGRIEDETEQRFASAAAGPIAIVDVGEHAAVIGLRAGARVTGAETFAAAGPSVPIRASAISFRGDRKRLADAAQELRVSLSAWPSFAGLSFHGIL